jgi:gamma-glutamyltranspeptidase / glutathione hydrolase
MRYKAALALLIVFVGTMLVCAQQRKEEERPARNPVRGRRGAVAGGTEFATEAGMRLFHQGGNAVDSGVAAMFAASVTEYSHFGFGGEAPILIRTKEGKVVSIAGVGTMPKAATADFYRQRRPVMGEILTLEPGGLKGIIPVAGLMPALVPGMVEAGLVALREYGTKSFSEVIEPAIHLAEGTPIDEMRSAYIQRSRRFFDLWPTSKAVFMPNGRTPMPGEIFVQADLARTLRSMAEAESKALKAGASRVQAIDAVRDYFYRGEIARKIDAFMKQHDGMLRYEDLAAFKLKPEEPLSTEYRGYTVYKPGFWSQGPVMLQALNMLESVDVRSLGRNSPEYIHQLVETLKLVYADRDTYYGDPNFNKIPMSTLLSREYAAERRGQISQRASLDFVPGKAGDRPRLHPSQIEMETARIDDALMANDTTCINTIDKDGVMFSATPSGAWLPSVIAGDTGIPLTQRAQSFLLVNGHPNELAGGKRPRVTLSPTLVTKDGKPAFTLSTPGGDNQDQSMLQILLNVIEFGMNAEGAIEAPRFQTRHLVSSFDNHAMNRGDLLLDDRLPGTTFNDLTQRGHRVSPRTKWSSGAAPVMIRMLPNGTIEAGADPYGYRTATAW